VGNLLRKDTPYLSDSVQLTIDGNRVEIPDDVKTLVILNFIYYQAGADIWGPDEDVTVLCFQNLTLSFSQRILQRLTMAFWKLSESMEQCTR
jgi:hypothetical protein